MEINSLTPAPNSYHMQDPEEVFSSLALCKGNTFLDLGCGAGSFSLHAAEIITNDGTVFAQDIQALFPELLVDEGRKRGLENIHPMSGDLCGPLALPQKSVDACLVAQVLHTVLNRPLAFIALFENLHQILKADGRLVILECKKDETHKGPPAKVRLTPEELTELAGECGFQTTQHLDLGFNYLLRFTPRKEAM